VAYEVKGLLAECVSPLGPPFPLPFFPPLQHLRGEKEDGAGVTPKVHQFLRQRWFLPRPFFFLSPSLLFLSLKACKWVELLVELEMLCATRSHELSLISSFFPPPLGNNRKVRRSSPPEFSFFPFFPKMVWGGMSCPPPVLSLFFLSFPTHSCRGRELKSAAGGVGCLPFYGPSFSLFFFSPFLPSLGSRGQRTTGE